jgi:GTP-binding protein HflX
MAENLLFATLDPTLRQISLPGIDKAILSDTVGFVSELPTQLVAAFKATLEEVVSADLLIHVRDIAHPDTEAQKDDVEQVLADIGVAEGTPRFEAWNKLDLLDGEAREDLLAEAVQARRRDAGVRGDRGGGGRPDPRRRRPPYRRPSPLHDPPRPRRRRRRRLAPPAW